MDPIRRYDVLIGSDFYCTFHLYLLSHLTFYSLKKVVSFFDFSCKVNFAVGVKR